MCENFNRVFVYMLREFLKQTDPKTIRGVSKERMLIQKKPTPTDFQKYSVRSIVGELYMTLELYDSRSGQVFTPYHVCQMMADISMGDTLKEQINTKGYITLSDPCCGAGATIIAGVNTVKKLLEKEHLNFQNYVLVSAQDIDELVALMCYLQISLLGVAGYVKVGNSLTDPITDGDSLENYWFTPMYFSDFWCTRRIIRRMQDILESDPK